MDLELAEYRGEAEPLVEQLKDAQGDWRWARKRSSRRTFSLAEVAPLWHVDGDLGRTQECVNNIDLVALGFMEYQRTVDAFHDLFDRLRRERVIPDAVSYGRRENAAEWETSSRKAGQRLRNSIGNRVEVVWEGGGHRNLFPAGLARGFVTVVISTLALIGVSLVFAPSSISSGALAGSLPFAAILAIVGLGQMLVVQQGGFDLSVAGGVSLAVVISTHVPAGNNADLLPAVLMAVGFAVAAGVVNGVLVGFLRLNAIIATIGMNALIYGAVFAVSGGVPTHHHPPARGDRRRRHVRASGTRSILLSPHCCWSPSS